MSETCPNCGNPFLAKTLFRGGVTLLTPSDEICLNITDNGDREMYFHIDGGDGSSQLEELSYTTIPKMDS